MPSENSIAVIITYYGDFPWYFSYFLHTCKYNPTVDFFLITDNKPPREHPANVKFVHFSIEEISKIWEKKLGFPVVISRPYKLCDFKPAYGFLFNELIARYDFWGHGDLDVVFGNIRRFMTHELLSEYDVLTILNDYISGSFTLFRNAHKTNTLFMESKDFKRVFTESENFCFDETNHIFQPLWDGIPIDEIKPEIDSMIFVVKRKQKENYIKAYFNTHIVEGLPGKMKWQEGTLIYKKKYEIMMFHLILYKHVYKPKKTIQNLKDSFTINASKKLLLTSNE